MANELSSRCESSAMESQRENNVLLSSCRPTRKEQLKVCCKPSYNMRRVKSKGAIVVLIRNYLVISLIYYLVINDSAHDQKPYFITLGITLPLMGWLADVCIGRYKMKCFSMWIMWTAFMLSTVSSAVTQIVDVHSNVDKYLTLSLNMVVSVGFGVYQANVIQFGLDQLQDASTDEIMSFISWYLWTTISGGIVVEYLIIYLHKEYLILAKLFVSFFLSMALILSIFTKNTFIKEPVTQNPFKLVYKVLKYAIKNKRPRHRSAFTYCEDDLPSRIDFGKSKYGGPFSTEQVEDVKTFIRLIAAIPLGCASTSVVFILDQVSLQMKKVVGNYIHDNTTKYYSNKFALPTSNTVAVLIPLYEFVVYPILQKHFSWVKSYNKFILGMLLQITRVITLMAVVIKVRYVYLGHSNHSNTIQCIFQEDQGTLSSSLDSKLMMLPNVLNSFSVVMLLVGGIEFICAQTPYYMRGLMFGAVYGVLLVFTLIGYGITWPFTSHSIKWNTGIISCGFWYLLLCVVILGITGTVITVLGTTYKKRKREDVLPNEQIYAERYYTKY